MLHKDPLPGRRVPATAEGNSCYRSPEPATTAARCCAPRAASIYPSGRTADSTHRNRGICHDRRLPVRHSAGARYPRRPGDWRAAEHSTAGRLESCSGRPRYGVSCPSICHIIIKRETTKARTISCSSLFLLRTRRVRKAQPAVGSGSAAYSSTTAGPDEYFGQTGWFRSYASVWNNKSLVTIPIVTGGSYLLRWLAR